MTRAVPRLATAALAAGVLLPTPGLAAPDSSLERAARAAREASFVGVAEVIWHDGTRTQRHTVMVQGAGGSVMVRGDNSLLLSPGRDLLVEHDGSWDLLWPSGTGGRARPPIGEKYRLEESPGPVIGGRPTTTVTVRQGEVLRERLHLDEQSGLLLGRVQFGPGAEPTRSVTFEVISVGASPPPPTVPAPGGGRSAEAVGPDRLPARSTAPERLADGYRRLGIYRHARLLHVLYGDGLYDLSVFQQRGRLDRGSLPGSGRPVDLGGVDGWHYEWAGGHVVVWEANRVVFSAVSDAPVDQILAAARSLPAADGGVSLIERLRRLCRALLRPLAA